MVEDITKFYALFRQAFGRYKPQIIALAVLGFSSGLLEGIGVNALIPLFSIALGGGQVGNDFISRKIADFFELLNLPFSVPSLVIFISVMFVAKAILSLILDYMRFRIAADYEQETRRSLFEKILSSNWTHLLKQKLGYLETMMMVDVPASGSLLGRLASGVTFVTGLLIYIFIAVNISLSITFLTLGLGIVFFVVFRPILGGIKALAMERNKIAKEMAHHVSENILGMKTVKAMMVEKGVVARGREFFAILRKAALRVPFLKSITTSTIEPVAVIFICLIFAMTYNKPGFNLAGLLVIVYLVNKIFNYIMQLQQIFQHVSDAAPHVRSIVSYEHTARGNQETISVGKPFVFKENLKFQSVSFFYDEDRPVLSDLNFEIKKGGMVGLIGPSGAGKTTLVDLFLRLFEPKAGQILVDGGDARELDMYDWRRHIGYVSQDIFLTNDTIANNIRFYNAGITNEQIRQTAQMANIDEFIETLPGKYETMIGERGVRLSGGERQRVVIARVLARKPDILILDEATSSLDNESEAQIQKVIKSLKGKITVLVIAHRLSTVMDSDKLLVLEGGRLVEEGEPKELLADKNSYFFRSYNTVSY